MPTPIPTFKNRVRSAALIGACLIGGAVCFVATLAVSFDLYGETGMDALAGFFVADLALGVIAAAVVVWARRRMWLNAAIIAIGIVSSFAIPAWIVATLRVGKLRALPADIAVVAFMAVGATGFMVWQDSFTGDESQPLMLAGFTAVATTAVLAWGRARGAREELLRALRQEAQSAHAAQRALKKQREAELAAARAQERSALARELHDGVAHQLAIAAMHTGAIATRDLAPEQVQHIAETARESTAHAGELLREALTTLRSGESSDLLPQPVSLEEVISEAESRGLKVVKEGPWLDEGSLADHKGILFQTAGILREALVNVQKHAPGAAAHVYLQSDDHGLKMRIKNPVGQVPSPKRNEGFGLIGMEERARIMGGKLQAGIAQPTGKNHIGEREFEVNVRVEWRTE